MYVALSFMDGNSRRQVRHSHRAIATQGARDQSHIPTGLQAQGQRRYDETSQLHTRMYGLEDPVGSAHMNNVLSRHLSRTYNLRTRECIWAVPQKSLTASYPINILATVKGDLSSLAVDRGGSGSDGALVARSLMEARNKDLSEKQRLLHYSNS